MAVLEAMAMGRAVIASDLGARREMIEHGCSGLLFRADDPTDLGAKVQEALGLGFDGMHAMGRRARALFLERYGPDGNMRQLESIYRSVIQEVEHRG